jgi:NAD(P)-dependent dehydrogenase (short-subunit alcohol dehydrogenase family)
MNTREVVAITGSNRGLGRALALAFAAEGAHLVLHARTSGALLEVAEDAKLAGATSVTFVTGDLLEQDLGERLAQAGRQNHGRVDTLILNAAMLGPMSPLIETPMDLFAQVMRTNVDAQVGLVSAIVPMMRASQRGRIVWLSSGLGRFGLPRYGVYCASKHAVEGLMKTVAEEHGDAGIISVSVAPGMVQTEMLKAALLGEDTSAYQTPEETAQAFVRLCGELKTEDNGKGLDIAEWL